MKKILFLIGMLVFEACYQRADAVMNDSETDDTAQPGTDTDSNNNDTSTHSGAETDSGGTVPDLYNQWILSDMVVEGKSVDLKDEFSFTISELEPPMAMNVLLFGQPNGKEIIARGSFHSNTCNAEVTFEEYGRIHFLLQCWPADIPSAMEPEGGFCPAECQEHTTLYVSAVNATASYEIVQETLSLYNDDRSNVLRYILSPIDLSDGGPFW